jgi:NAD-dependent SIR2 family protein deacetylase
MREFQTINAANKETHKTGRKCENTYCQGDLFDNHIRFKESLNYNKVITGYAHAHEADLMLCLGSSLRVYPAANMVKKVIIRETFKGKIVIVNL